MILISNKFVFIFCDWFETFLLLVIFILISAVQYDFTRDCLQSIKQHCSIPFISRMHISSRRHNHKSKSFPTVLQHRTYNNTTWTSCDGKSGHPAPPSGQKISASHCRPSTGGRTSCLHTRCNSQDSGDQYRRPNLLSATLCVFHCVALVMTKKCRGRVNRGREDGEE